MAFGWIYHCLCFMSISGAMIEGAIFGSVATTSDSIMCGFLFPHFVSLIGHCLRLIRYYPLARYGIMWRENEVPVKQSSRLRTLAFLHR